MSRRQIETPRVGQVWKKSTSGHQPFRITEVLKTHAGDVVAVTMRRVSVPHDVIVLQADQWRNYAVHSTVVEQVRSAVPPLPAFSELPHVAASSEGVRRCRARLDELVAGLGIDPACLRLTDSPRGPIANTTREACRDRDRLAWELKRNQPPGQRFTSREIAVVLNYRDHSTALDAVRRHQRRLDAAKSAGVDCVASQTIQGGTPHAGV